MPRPALALVETLPPGLRPAAGRADPDHLYAALRRAILRLDLPPGAPVPEPALAAAAGLSRTPVRDVLRRLREEGLVEIHPHVGSFVTGILPAVAEEALRLRLLLETDCAAFLAARPGRQPALRRLLAEQRAALEEGDMDAVYALDERFHAGLFEAAGRPLMWAACRIARGLLERVHHAAVAAPGRAAAAVAAHGAILAAIETGGPEAARAAMAAHLDGNAADLAALRARHPEWLAP